MSYPYKLQRSGPSVGRGRPSREAIYKRGYMRTYMREYNRGIRRRSNRNLWTFVLRSVGLS